jgi:hypothetical protein
MAEYRSIGRQKGGDDIVYKPAVRIRVGGFAGLVRWVHWSKLQYDDRTSEPVSTERGVIRTISIVVLFLSYLDTVIRSTSTKSTFAGGANRKGKGKARGYER